MSIPILLVVLEIWSTRSSPWTPSCSWQSSPWRPPPTRPLASCYRCHYTQWSPQKDGIKIRALVVELLHLKERGQKCDRHTDRQTHTSPIKGIPWLVTIFWYVIGLVELIPMTPLFKNSHPWLLSYSPKWSSKLRPLVVKYYRKSGGDF